jgi:hypothetical protein
MEGENNCDESFQEIGLVTRRLIKEDISSPVFSLNPSFSSLENKKGEKRE